MNLRNQYDKPEVLASIQEVLKGNQHKIDKNKNGRIDAHDFKLLKKGKNNEKGESAAHEKMEEAAQRDTPGQHQCAVHVKHKTMGEGKTIFSQHAEPLEDGSIAWYDVMFEHGIEKKVPVENLEIVVSEAHNNHKKK